MLSKILGFIWVVLGGIWVFRPEALKNRLQKKMTRKMWKVVFVFLFFFGLFMLASVVKTPGILPKLIAVTGLVISIKAVMFITSKAGDKFIVWCDTRSTVFFRIFACAIIVLGIMLLYA